MKHSRYLKFSAVLMFWAGLAQASPLPGIVKWETVCGVYKVSYTTATNALYISWGETKDGSFSQVDGTPVSTWNQYAYKTLNNGMKNGSFVLRHAIGTSPKSESPVLTVDGNAQSCEPIVYTRKP